MREITNNEYRIANAGWESISPERSELRRRRYAGCLSSACKNLVILAIILNSQFAIRNSSAAVPLKWTVETSRATTAQFEAYRGEALALEADLMSYGKPLELSGIAQLYWQTNGMGSAYWESTAAVNSNRISALWLPQMDVGAKSYNCFLGVRGSVYRAAFNLRLRPSPGVTPNVLPLPVPVIDFAQVRVLNPPWGSGGGGVNTNAVEVIANKAVATNALTRALASRTGADIKTGGDYEPFGYTDPENDIAFNISQLDYGIVDTGIRIDELEETAFEAFAQKDESVANQGGEANDLTVNGLTVNDTAKFNDNVEIEPHSLYIGGTVIEDTLGTYTKRHRFDDLEDEVEAHRNNANIHVTPSASDPTFSNAVAAVGLSLGHTRSAVLSDAADFYRTGRDGEVGTGLAYTAIEGNGAKRFAAAVPAFDTTVILTPADDDDPIVSAFGGSFTGSGLVREISFLGSASAPGRYDVAEADFSMTNGIPVVATVRRNILSPSPSLEGIRVTGTSGWLEFDTSDGVHHGCYGFYTDGQTVYYTDEWSTKSDWGVADRSFAVSVTDPCEAEYEMTVFGSAGTLQTEEGVTDAVTDYIQRHSIQKEVLVERTGREGEFGDGWGYKVYDWTSEFRQWRLVVPRLDVTTTATAARTEDPQYYSIVGNNSQYPSNPMLDLGLAPGSVSEGVSVTHGKTSPDSCTSADLTFSAWKLQGNGVDVLNAVAAGVTYGSSQYGFEIRECAIPRDAVYEIDLYVPGYYANISNVFHCTMTNFRPSGTSVTYDNTVHCWSWRNGELFTEGEFTTHPSFGFSTLRYAANFKSVTINATRVADTVTAHYFWDEGMKCTWRIAVTNGCFYGSKISNKNLTIGE